MLGDSDYRGLDVSRIAVRLVEWLDNLPKTFEMRSGSEIPKRPDRNQMGQLEAPLGFTIGQAAVACMTFFFRQVPIIESVWLRREGSQS